MTRLAGELGQGLLPLRFAPGSLEDVGPWLMEGFRRAGNGKGWEGFEIQADVHVTITDDPSEARDALKPELALYIGGMGAVGKNFHNEAMIKAGFPEEARRIQHHYLKGERREAIAAVPDAYVDRTSLIGTRNQIRERYQAWATSGITGLIVRSLDPEVLDLMAQLAAETPAIGPAAAWEAIEADRSSTEAT
jgi:alkanesulfonate monooxygenase SsuD/methylene tetrahydromethanopterin reductase-like flavin-dependent oxidoreductase (luciferase family)